MKVLSSYSLKGGVGKTAAAVNIADYAARNGIKTLLMDLDPQGAAAFYFRVKPAKTKLGKTLLSGPASSIRDHIRESDYPNLDILPAHQNFRKFEALLADSNKAGKRLRSILDKLGKDYQLLVLDCPPGLGYLSEAVLHASDIVMVPIIPTTLSERAFEQLTDFIKQKGLTKTDIRPFFSMVQAQKSLHRRTIPRMLTRYPQFLRTPIPFSKDVENMGERRAPLSRFAPTRPATRAFSMLFDELFPEQRHQR